jgi:hypothetical protein
MKIRSVGHSSNTYTRNSAASSHAERHPLRQSVRSENCGGEMFAVEVNLLRGRRRGQLKILRLRAEEVEEEDEDSGEGL